MNIALGHREAEILKFQFATDSPSDRLAMVTLACEPMSVCKMTNENDENQTEAALSLI
jgi:hypothetical protein